MKIDRKVFFFTFLFLVISICTTLAYNPTYYKLIYINNTGGSEQTYYQVPLNITYDTSMQTDFDDLRVKYYNGDEWVFVPYWIENKVDGNWCKLWFNATSIPANSWCNDTYRLYYGDNLANSESNGDTTFLFFDDFEGTSLDADKWNTYQIHSNGILTVEDSLVKLNAYLIVSKTYQITDGVLEAKVYKVTKTENREESNLYARSPNNAGNAFSQSYSLFSWGGDDSLRISKDDSALASSSVGNTANDWYLHRFILNGQSLKAKIFKYSDETLKGEVETTDSTYSSGYLGLRVDGAGPDSSDERETHYDWIRVRKYAPTELTALLGEEHSMCTSPTISFLTNSTPGTTSVTITWTTDKITDNRVKYSKSPDLSNYSWSSWDNDTTSVSITLTGLYPNTVYYYQAWSYNGTYSECYTTEPSSQPYQNFTTLNLSGIEPLYINIEETGEGYIKINASWIGFNAFETGHYFVFCGMSYGDVKSKKANGDGKLTVEETLYGLFVEGEEYCCKAAAYRGNLSTNPIYTDEACFIATSNKTLKQTSYGNYMDNLINISSESNVTTWASALSDPYKDRMGMTFFGIIFVLPFIAMWIRGSNTIIPSILGLILGGFIWAYMPEKFVHMAYLFIIISIAGVIYGIFRQKI